MPISRNRLSGRARRFASLLIIVLATVIALDQDGRTVLLDQTLLIEQFHLERP